jgi:hypothetical protein
MTSGANSVLTELEFALFLFAWSHFQRRTGVHPRIKSEGMLRRKML